MGQRQLAKPSHGYATRHTNIKGGSYDYQHFHYRRKHRNHLAISLLRMGPDLGLFSKFDSLLATACAYLLSGIFRINYFKINVTTQLA